MNNIFDCPQCPHAVGDSYDRDCDFPFCVGWRIEKNVKPIPIRDFDFDFWHEEYDGENGLAGAAKDYFDAVDQIIEIQNDFHENAKTTTSEHDPAFAPEANQDR